MVQRFGSIVTSEIISTYCSHFINSSPREILPHFIRAKMSLSFNLNNSPTCSPKKIKIHTGSVN